MAQAEPAASTVLAHSKDAYQLPFFTGAFVVWNEVGHPNAYAWSPERVYGARAIFEEKATPDRIRRYAEEYEVDFALVRKAKHSTVEALVESGAFVLAEPVPGYVVLERAAPAR